MQDVIDIVRWTTLSGCIEECFGPRLRASGYHTDGEKYSMSQKAFRREVLTKGCWGFCEGKRKIHVWIGKRATLEQVVRLMAHEAGHMERPHRRTHKAEESKAGSYEAVSVFALRVARDLVGGVGRVEIAEVRDG